MEIKSGATLNPDFFEGLQAWLGLAGAVAGQAYLVYGGDQAAARQGIQVVPWKRIGELAPSA